jgi:glycosyltransferase involved in cell wall biosynthesis
VKKQSLIPITVLIATKNEERNISDCLRSVRFADQILVIDSCSTDKTKEISLKAGAEVHEFNYRGGWPKKRNWALETLDIRNEWILILDADERVSPSLRHEIETAIKVIQVDGYYTQWKFIFLKKWMRHSWSHGWMLRLFRKGKARYEDLGMRAQGGWDAEVHENIVSDGLCKRLIHPLDHESNQDLSFWIRKQNEFSDWNAARRLTQLKLPLPPISAFFSTDPVKRRKLLKALFIRLPGKPLLMFFFLFVIKKGFLDGIEGYYFCKLRAMHEFNIGVKVFEARKNLLQ